MFRGIPAEIFIATLTEMWEDERLREKARLRRQIEAQTLRFMAAFGTPGGGARSAPAWTPQGRRAAEPALQPMRGH